MLVGWSAALFPFAQSSTFHLLHPPRAWCGMKPRHAVPCQVIPGHPVTQELQICPKELLKIHLQNMLSDCCRLLLAGISQQSTYSISLDSWYMSKVFIYLVRNCVRLCFCHLIHSATSPKFQMQRQHLHEAGSHSKSLSPPQSPRESLK